MVTIASSGEAALEALSLSPDIQLILMDIDLGHGMDGTETAQRLLEQRAIPIVFLTNHRERDYVDRVRAITNYGYLIKNSGEFVLVESIEMALGARNHDDAGVIRGVIGIRRDVTDQHLNQSISD